MKKYDIHQIMEDYQKGLGDGEKAFESIGIVDPLNDLFKRGMLTKNERIIRDLIRKREGRTTFNEVFDNFFDSYDED